MKHLDEKLSNYVLQAIDKSKSEIGISPAYIASRVLALT